MKDWYQRAHPERLIVSGSNQSISAYVGEDVILNCSVDSHIPPEDIKQVSWKKTDEDKNILVLIYQNNETFPDSSDERYRDRVQFFTDEMPKGNFSLRLKSVRTEDKGVYMCQVFAGGLSANATAVLRQLGFSTLHIIVLILCIAAGSGAVLLLSCLIYCRSKNTVTSSTIWNLQVSLVFCPNICMFFAFILWGLTEGYLNETVTCCALYILRPVMLIWALPYLKYLQDNLKSWTRLASITREFAVLTAVVYSVLFKCGWDRSSVPGIIYGIFFGIVLLLCLRIFRRGFTRIEEKWGRLCFLPVAQFIQLMFSLGSPNLAFLAVALVQSLLLLSIPCLIYRRRWIILCMIPLMLLDIILVIYVHVHILEREKDYLEWICVFVFLEVLRIMVIFEDQDYEAECSGVQQHTERREQGSNALPLCNEIMYMFGAVGLVLLNSVTLTAELLLKTRHGERVLKDLRVVVFSSECFYILYWLVFQVHTFWKIKPESIHIGRNLLHRCYLKNTPETREMVNLSATDSAVSQTELDK